MVFGFIRRRSTLSPAQLLELANISLANAQCTKDPKIAVALGHETGVSLSRAIKAAKRAKVLTIRDGVATAYIELGIVLDSHEKHDDAQTSYKKADELG
jgi:hypothetical protein